MPAVIREEHDLAVDQFIEVLWRAVGWLWKMMPDLFFHERN